MHSTIETATGALNEPSRSHQRSHSDLGYLPITAKLADEQLHLNISNRSGASAASSLGHASVSGSKAGHTRRPSGGKGLSMVDPIWVITNDENGDTQPDLEGSSWSGSLMSNSLGSLGFKSQRSQKAQTNIERDLMRQLEILQADKKREQSEMEVKLKQREAAIATLERTVQVQGDTIKMLREELDELQKDRERMQDRRPKKDYRDRRSASPPPPRRRAVKDELDNGEHHSSSSRRPSSSNPRRLSETENRVSASPRVHSRPSTEQLVQSDHSPVRNRGSHSSSSSLRYHHQSRVPASPGMSSRTDLDMVQSEHSPMRSRPSDNRSSSLRYHHPHNSRGSDSDRLHYHPSPMTSSERTPRGRATGTYRTSLSSPATVSSRSSRYSSSRSRSPSSSRRHSDYLS